MNVELGDIGQYTAIISKELVRQQYGKEASYDFYIGLKDAKNLSEEEATNYANTLAKKLNISDENTIVRSTYFNLRDKEGGTDMLFYLLIGFITLYHYYYCPTGKKSGCMNPVMVKESDLMECVRDSVKGFVDNVVSLEEILSSINQSRINKELIREYSRQIAQNNQQLDQIRTFKTSLYENMVSGLIEKHDFLSMKNTYNVRIAQLEQAISTLEEKRTDVMENRSERNRWIENFKRFSEIEELDRKVIIQLVHSIKVVGKNEFQIEFNYQNEYEKAISLIAPTQERMVI